MSIRAMNWALDQATGDPRAQILLYVVADTASEDGVAWPSADWMASKSQQSRATVYRRLTQLQEMGLLVVFPRYIDSDGKIWNAPAGGRRRTSPEIRLQFGVFIKQNDVSPDDGEDAETEEPQSQLATGVVSTSDTPVAPQRQGSSHCSDSNNPHLNQEEDSPPTPQGGSEPEQFSGQEGEAKAWPHAQSWAEFEQAWQEPILRQTLARNVWSSLSDEEHDIAKRAARGYVAWRRGQKKPPNVLNAHTFLKERDAHTRYAELAPKVRELPPPPVFVAEGSPEWQAGLVLGLITGRGMPRARSIQGHGVGEMAAAPLPAVALLLAQFSVDDADWRIVEEGTKPHGAWRERLNECLGYWIEPSNHRTGETIRKEVLGTIHENWPVMKRGLRVPSEWPPAKHPREGPQSTMMEDDERELASNGR